MTRCLAAIPIASLLVAGCAGGTPQPAQVKGAARDWASAHLHPNTLMVTLVVVTRDEQRGRVRLRADGRPFDLRLSHGDGGWKVTSVRRG